MDTKSKNEPDKPAVARALLVCLAGLALLFAIDIGKNRDYIYDNPFLKGDLFYSIHALLNVHDIVKYNVEYRRYNLMNEKEKVSEAVIRQWRDEFDASMSEAMLHIDSMPSPRPKRSPDQSWTLSASSVSAIRALQERTGHWMADEWNKQVEAVWNAQLLEASKQYVADRDSEQQNLKRKMERIDPIVKYTINDRRNHETYSNQTDNPDEVLLSELYTETARTMTFPLKEPIKQLNSLNDYFKQNQLEGTFTFYANVEPADPAFATEMVMAKDYIRLLSMRERLQYEIFGLAAALMSMALLMLYLYKNKVSDNGLKTITARWQAHPYRYPPCTSVSRYLHRGKIRQRDVWLGHANSGRSFEQMVLAHDARRLREH
ncbi:hypothetical protein FE783_27270 [Paenibacillus mesophilus]|uniref:hypothetical protein n=1 Tax=Paenibacillus mesophilus TaxID=2582849 RepID=UPI00110E5FE8|nr:hypothetical protein [Paenibacillus mesophilus]TMV46124.1 hypothetical protein FE783_27270 [Paenibacillus mesophilus]